MASKYALLQPAQPDFRIVLVGKTGTGKSSAGNTILRKTAFQCDFSASGVTTTCRKDEADFEDKRLAVVDTPGLFDTNKTEEEIKKEVVWCISYIAPGPHVFLVVIQPGRFSKEELETVKTIQLMFGEQATRYMMALFTHGDILKAKGVIMEKFIHTNKDLRDFIRECGGRYHVFDNTNQDPSQVQELLEKIDTMVKSNGEKFYTNEMLEGFESAIQEEMERLQKKYPGMSPEEARRRAERDNKLIKAVLAALGAAGGAAAGIGIEIAAGAAIGFIGGPIGAAVGACVGLGLAVAGITAVKEKKCIIQ